MDVKMDIRTVQRTDYAHNVLMIRTRFTSNTWHKVLEFIDNGDWGGGHPNCGGTDHTIITWGGPIAIFRWDNIDDMDIKDFSIREMQILLLQLILLLIRLLFTF
jgi:hypothetical protein